MTQNTILLIHGGPGLSCDYFNELSIYLTQKKCTVSSYNQGESFDVKDYNEDSTLEALIIELHKNILSAKDDSFNKKINIVAHSFGTILIGEYLSRFGHENIHKICLISPFFDASYESTINDLSTYFVGDIESIASEKKVDTNEAMKNFYVQNRNFYFSQDDDSVALNVFQSMTYNYELSKKFSDHYFSNYDLNKYFEKVKDNICIINGLDDRIIARSKTDRQKIKYPNFRCKKVEIPKGGHFPFLGSSKELCLKEIDSFLIP